MGWNSWDSFLGSPTEAVFYEVSASFQKILAPHGYEYLVIVCTSIPYSSLFIALLLIPLPSHLYTRLLHHSLSSLPYPIIFLIISLQDAGWYDINTTSGTVQNDGYSRLVPSDTLWPSGTKGAGFKPITEYVHSLGLKFGFHIL